MIGALAVVECSLCCRGDFALWGMSNHTPSMAKDSVKGLMSSCRSLCLGKAGHLDGKAVPGASVKLTS